MRLWRRLPLAVVGLQIAGAAQGQPLDCDHLLHSKVPFELEKIDRSTNKIVKTQTFRSDNQFATMYRALPTWTNKVVTQRGLVKSSRVPNGKQMSYTYDKPIKGFYFEEVTQLAATNRLEEASHTEAMDIKNLGEDDISVGPCIVHVSHYKVSYPDNKIGRMSSELWYSKELDAVLKSINRKKDNSGNETTEVIETTDIVTDFIPLQ